MAMQTPVVRTVDGVTVSSTFSSGMLVRLGQSLGELVHPGARTRELTVARILGVVNVAFLGGAIVGGVLIELDGQRRDPRPAARAPVDRVGERSLRADRA